MKMATIIIALLVASCGGTSAPIVATSPAPTNTTAAAPPITRPPTEIEISQCSGAVPKTWSVMCQAVELLDEIYVDEVPRAELVAAANLGVSRAPEHGVAEPPGEVFRCTLPDEAFLSVCESILDRLSTDHDDASVLAQAALEGMFRYALDPFSSYVSPDFADQFDELGSGVIYDLGFSVSARSISGDACGVIDAGCQLRVLNVFPITPAAEHGVLVGDVIVAVDGIPLLGLSADAAVASLGGTPGVLVEITISRDTGEIIKELLREDFRFEPVEFEMLTNSVAYLRLNDFSQPSAQLVGQVLQLADVRSARAMILDLRDNPGGLVLAAQAIASQFLDGGTVMVERGRDYVFDWDVIDGGLANSSMRLIVLVNRGSASASEVLAAALQERGRALVIGEPTFGKNLVQQVYTANDGGQLRITVARWETPGGLDIGITGLDPDIFVEPDILTGTDPIFEEALSQLGLQSGG